MKNKMAVVSVKFILKHDGSGKYLNDEHLYTYKAPIVRVKGYDFIKEIEKESRILTSDLYKNSAFQYFATGVEFLGYVEA